LAAIDSGTEPRLARTCSGCSARCRSIG
jgi:hypothetical protein